MVSLSYGLLIDPQRGGSIAGATPYRRAGATPAWTGRLRRIGRAVNRPQLRDGWTKLLADWRRRGQE